MAAHDRIPEGQARCIGRSFRAGNGDAVQRRTTALAVTFTVLEAVAALGLVAISVHGPEGLTLAAPMYFVCAAALTWWAARRFDSARVVVGVGLLGLVVAPGLVMSLAGVEELAYERRIAATRVTDVRDEAILSSTGQPIGVRLSYTVSVPKRGYFGILPQIYSAESRTEPLRLDAKRWTIDGRSDPTPFEPGREHTMHVELYPSIVAIAHGQRCLFGETSSPLPADVIRSPLRVSISETPYGAEYRGGREERTRGDYDLAELYRGVLAEGLPACTALQSAR